jgi:hypothetical protein
MVFEIDATFPAQSHRRQEAEEMIGISSALFIGLSAGQSGQPFDGWCSQAA